LFMIVCPNCNHQNPDGAVQCEACYTPLPEMTDCPNCGASVQADASFCGQCGFNLKAATPPIGEEATSSGATIAPDFAANFNRAEQGSNLASPDPVASPDLVETLPNLGLPDVLAMPSVPDPQPEVSAAKASAAETSEAENSTWTGAETSGAETSGAPKLPPPPPPPMATPPMAVTQVPPLPPDLRMQSTQLQVQTAKLLHVQTNTMMELPLTLTVIHIGKQNERVPPDIDVSGFPNSEIVSRIHADIRVEGGIYYIEDVGSSNGTYINNIPLPIGNRHRLRAGDRIALGKGDKVTFLFQLP
jgi:ribosomal protein L40E